MHKDSCLISYTFVKPKIICQMFKMSVVLTAAWLCLVLGNQIYWIMLSLVSGLIDAGSPQADVCFQDQILSVMSWRSCREVDIKCLENCVATYIHTLSLSPCHSLNFGKKSSFTFLLKHIHTFVLSAAPNTLFFFFSFLTRDDYPHSWGEREEV